MDEYVFILAVVTLAFGLWWWVGFARLEIGVFSAILWWSLAYAWLVQATESLRIVSLLFGFLGLYVMIQVFTEAMSEMAGV